MKKTFFQLALLCSFFGLLALPSQAQQIGKPDGNLINFFNTNGQGGQLAHRQSGFFGGFGAADQWISLGRPNFGGFPLPVYGLRIQENQQAGIFSLNDNGAPDLDLEIQWGGNNSNGKFRLNYAADLNNPASNQTVLTATNQGRVGIGADNPFYKLDVRTEATGTEFYNIYSINNRTSGGAGFFDGSTYGIYAYANNNPEATFAAGLTGYTSSNPEGAFANRYGVRGFAFGSNGTSYGVYGYAGASNSTNYGLYGIATNFSATQTAYAVYGTVTGTTGTGYAGFFNGDVQINGTLTVSSDKRLKKNIKTEESVLNRVMKLRPSTYEYRTNDRSLSGVVLAEGQQHGFIAQEMEKIFPELVKDIEHTIPGETIEDPEALARGEEPQVAESQTQSYKSVNYVAMVPILTKAIQEQQEQLQEEKARNEELKQELDNLRSDIANLKSSSTASGGLNEDASILYQNTPNPFNESTTIRYAVSPEAVTASMIIFDMNGRQLKTFSNLSKGEGSLTVSKNELSAGMYLYSLIVDGKEAATRRMILTEF